MGFVISTIACIIVLTLINKSGDKREISNQEASDTAVLSRVYGCGSDRHRKSCGG